MAREDISLARRLLAEGKHEEALRVYEAYLEAQDGDDEIRLEMGLVRLVSGDREGFHRTGAEYVRCMTPEVLCLVSQRTRDLWREYARAGVRLAGTTVLGASVALAAGCRGKPVPAQPPVEVAAKDQPPSLGALAVDAAAPVADGESTGRPRNRYVAVHFDDSTEKP